MESGFILTEEIFNYVIEYIETTEESKEYRWGERRTIEELKAVHGMPDIYYKLMEIKDNG